jgi:hypothetical protein
LDVEGVEAGDEGADGDDSGADGEEEDGAAGTEVSGWSG